MRKYRNRAASGVQEYEIGEGWIEIRFDNEPYSYLYTNESAGNYNIQQMQLLAQMGRGLATFINKYVRKKYASKSR